jgi:hypothetical protein
VPLARLDHKVLLVLSVRKAQLVPRALLEHKAQPARRVPKDRKAIKVTKVMPAQTVLQVLPVRKVLKVCLVPWARKVPPVLTALKARWDHRALRV